MNFYLILWNNNSLRCKGKYGNYFIELFDLRVKKS